MLRLRKYFLEFNWEEVCSLRDFPGCYMEVLEYQGKVDIRAVLPRISILLEVNELHKLAKISKSRLGVSWREMVILVVKEYGTNLSSSEDMILAMLMLLTILLLSTRHSQVGKSRTKSSYLSIVLQGSNNHPLFFQRIWENPKKSKCNETTVTNSCFFHLCTTIPSTSSISLIRFKAHGAIFMFSYRNEYLDSARPGGPL